MERMETMEYYKFNYYTHSYAFIDIHSLNYIFLHTSPKHKHGRLGFNSQTFIDRYSLSYRCLDILTDATIYIHTHTYFHSMISRHSLSLTHSHSLSLILRQNVW